MTFVDRLRFKLLYLRFFCISGLSQGGSLPIPGLSREGMENAKGIEKAKGIQGGEEKVGWWGHVIGEVGEKKAVLLVPLST